MLKLGDVRTKLYLFSFFDDFILIYPLYTLLFADKGISALGISSLLIVWSATGFLLEIPTGTIADKYSRKKVLLSGIALRAVGYLFWLFMPNYLGFLIGFLLWGIKGAITSGTLEALVYDELSRLGKLKDYARITGRMSALGGVGVILAGFSASFLAHHGYIDILWLSVMAVVISGMAVLRLPTPRKAVHETEPNQSSVIKTSLMNVVRRPKVLFLVAFMSIVTGLGAVDEYFNLFFREKGFSNEAVAFWIGIVYAFGALGSILAHRLQGKKVPVKLALFGWALLLLITSSAPKILTPFLLGVYVMFYFGIEVLFNTYLQTEISDRTRATTTSVGGFFSELFAILSFLIVSIGASKVSYTFGFRLIAITIVACGVALTLYSRKHNISLSS